MREIDRLIELMQSATQLCYLCCQAVISRV